MIKSMLETDFYTYTVGQAVFDHFRNTPVRYQFINRRESDKFDEDFFIRLADNIEGLSDLKIQPDELDYLRSFNLFKPDFLKFVEDYQFDPGQVNLFLSEEKLFIDIEGPWEETIFWEVPLLSTISSLYFENEEETTSDLSHIDFINRTYEKRKILDNLKFIEFGTRRRRSFRHQELALKCLKDSPGFLGTSNMHFAQTMNIPCLGTQSHQLFSGLSAFYPVESANYYTLKLWLETYQGKLGVALTDTFGSDNFFEYFPMGYHDLIFEGVRQDSGNPLKFAQKAIDYYRSREIDPKTKKIIFSDSLDPEKCQEIHQAICREIKDIYALGTNLTNDIPDGHKPLQIVIKLTDVLVDKKWKSVCKLSDDPGKESGDPEEVKRVKQLLNIK